MEESIRRYLKSLETNVEKLESQGELADINELECVMQVLKLKLNHPELTVRDVIIDSFNLQYRVQLKCLLNGQCPINEN